MLPVYAISVILGVIGLLVWVFLALTASSVAGKETLDPERRYGFGGRAIVAGLTGFGLGGLSASYGGWASGLAIVAAAGGAALMIGAAHYLGVAEAADEDST